MSAVVKTEDNAVQSYEGGVLAVIERAARDQSVDVDKLERLLAMQERVQARDAKMAYTTALAEMQPKLPIITERGKILNKAGETQSTYATWEDINEIIKPILADHGFCLSFRGRKDGTDIITVGILSHKAGHSEETEVSLPADNSGSKNVVQGIGSSKSYGKRYAAFDLLNITTRGEDDDGRKAGLKTITEAQDQEIEALIDKSGADRLKFMRYFGVNAIGDLPADRYDRAIALLKQKASK